ncbi:MAG: M23 family metallopeptidase [Deltaproteobacteria bacterium]|nr:M23 family metallopeptidase [Deltaproteobacteria bacterium]
MRWTLLALALATIGCSGAIGGASDDPDPASEDASQTEPDSALSVDSESDGLGFDASIDDTRVATDSAPIDSGIDTSSPVDTGASPICLASAAGAYCGNDEMKDADPSTLYQCPGPGKPPTSSTKCDAGCQIEPAGTPDHCKVVSSEAGYRLPWPPGTTMRLTQDCNDACCADHVGVDQWAWDFANGTGFTVVAARGGTVTHLKINSTSGCGSSSCAGQANLIVIDHGDGTQALYMHLAGGSLRAGVTCGATVARGQPLATAGTTGWSTGLHLHFQVGKVHTGAPTCECGASGTGCATTTVPWANLWVSSTYPTVPITFEEWPATATCANRRITMPASTNSP